MAKNSKILNAVLYLVGILVSLAVGFGMISKVLVIPWIPTIITLVAGWIVVILTIIGLLLAVINLFK